MTRCLFALALMLASAAAEPLKVTVSLLRCAEDHWQQKLQQESDGTKLLALAAKHEGVDVVVEATLPVTLGQKARWTKAKELEFPTRWEAPDGNPFALTAEHKDKRLVGSIVEIELRSDDGGQPIELQVSVKHDYAAPTWTSFSYPVSTVTDDALKKVPLKLPQFHRIEWESGVEGSSLQPVIVASLLVNELEKPLMRWFIVVSTSNTAFAEELSHSRLQQTIIRAPEWETVELLTRKTRTNAEISAQLHQWVRAGRAKIVSDLSGAKRWPKPLDVKVGTEFVWWTIMDQMTPISALETAYELPEACEPLFVGDAMSYNEGTWKAQFSPRAPLLVDWPAVWPGQARPKLDWTQQADTFRETVATKVNPSLKGPEVLSVCRPADKFEATVGAKRWLDVTEIMSSEKPGTSSSQRVAVLGFAVSESSIDELLALHHGAGDDGVLNRLLDDTQAGRAVLSTFAVCRVDDEGGRTELFSIRQHNYPTEMQTFPSAWQDLYVGDHLQADGWSAPDAATSRVSVSMDSHLGLPLRAEFSMSVKHADFVLWQPKPVTVSMSAVVDCPHHGARLLSVMSIPSYVTLPAEMREYRAMVFMVRNDDEGPTAKKEDQFATASSDPPPLECEALIFEIDAADEGKYQTEGFQLPDEKRLDALRQEVSQGKAKLLSRSWATASTGSFHASVAQECPVVTECDCDFEYDPQQYRPTALDVVRAGTDFTVNVQQVDASGGTLRLSGEITLVHHADVPRIPTLAEQLTSLHASDGVKLVPLEAYELKWHPENDAATGRLLFEDNKPRCLGSQKIPGRLGETKRHVAFMTVRRGK